MFLTKRHPPEQLLQLEALSHRTSLDDKNHQQLERLSLGYQGECLYDHVFTEVGHENLHIYRDIYLKIEESTNQYDTLIITDHGIIVNEIKNFKGTYTVSEGSWALGDFVLPDDPFAQLRRAIGKLRRLSNLSDLNFKVSGKLIFPNEECTLIINDEKLKENIIIRSNLRRYFERFKQSYSSNYASAITNVIGEHIVENPYLKEGVAFDDIRHGLYCEACRSFDLSTERYHLRCLSCGTLETKETHLVRAISDFKHLFEKLPITTDKMMRFTGGLISKRTVQRVLDKYCDRHGISKSSTYTFKYYDFNEAMKHEGVKRRYKDHLLK